MSFMFTKLQTTTAIPASSLYDGKHHGDCAVMGVMDLSRHQSHKLLLEGLEAARRLAHRGGVLHDKKTSHGVGILATMPRRWVQKVGKELFPGHAFSSDRHRYIVAPFFWKEHIQRSRVNAIVGPLIEQLFGTEVQFAWRTPPMNPDALGPLGKADMPRIQQLWILAPKIMASESNLLRVRKRIESEFSANNISSEELAILSFGKRQLVYKGLMLPKHLADFYLDLQDSDFEIHGAVLHVRMATNTSPDWTRVQPMSLLAHNGEVNTHPTCLADMDSIRAELEARQDHSLLPLYDRHATDSGNLNLRVEATALAEDLGLAYALALHLPSAWHPKMSKAEIAFKQSCSARVVGSGGPVALYALSDGVLGVASDDFGLRPIRYAQVGSRVYVASERGAWPHKLQNSDRQLKGGQILIADSRAKRLSVGRQVISELLQKHDFESLTRNITTPGEAPHVSETSTFTELCAQAAAYGLDGQTLHVLLSEMGSLGKESSRAMGDDNPLPLFSRVGRDLTSSLSAKWAQITNPALDHLREARRFSLRTFLGPMAAPFGLSEVEGLMYDSPLLSRAEWTWLQQERTSGFGFVRCVHEASEESLQNALQRIRSDTIRFAHEGKVAVVLDCAGAGEFDGKVQTVPAALGVRQARDALMEIGALRRVRIVLSSTEIRSSAHLALAISAGADLVFPGLVYQLVEAFADYEGMNFGGDNTLIEQRIIKSMEDGLLKTICRLGIATIAGYRGGMHHESKDLADDVCDILGARSKTGGRTLQDLEMVYSKFATDSAEVLRTGVLPEHGIYKAHPSHGEATKWNGDIQVALQAASYLWDQELPDGLEPDPARFRNLEDVAASNGTFSFRDLLQLPAGNGGGSIDPLSIAPHFNGGSMSLGALTPWTHLAIAMGLNHVGAISSSGEGGHPPERFQEFREGLPSGACKRLQIASGHFGVDLFYLAMAEEIEIKFAQAAKPGLGGELPGEKVWYYIASLRNVVKGQALISPPPQHLMYSIEDVLSLVHVLRQLNPRAKIWLKVAAKDGIGALALGAVACNADGLLICGFEGGTGASPYTAIAYAGTPVEIALAEANQALCKAGVRDKLILGVDGGLGLSAKEIVKLAALGAQSFGLGTALMMTLGCVKANMCHKRCPADIATGTKEGLQGRWENVALYLKGFFMAIAEEVAALGFASLDQVVGRVDLLSVDQPGSLNFGPLLHYDDAMKRYAGNLKVDSRNDLGFHTDPTPGMEELASALSNLGDGPQQVTVSTELLPEDRGFGISQFGKWAHDDKLPRGLVVHSQGWAGQYYGAYMPPGVEFHHVGGTSDYAGNSLSGGSLVFRVDDELASVAHQIDGVGNLVMHAATAGASYAGCVVGNRAVLRNSGATLFALGAGDDLAEYMTGGKVVILGKVGENVGAGMSGGIIILPKSAAEYANPDSVEVQSLGDEDWEALRADLGVFREKVGAEAVDAALAEIGGEEPGNFIKLTSIIPLADVSEMDNTPVSYDEFLAAA